MLSVRIVQLASSCTVLAVVLWMSSATAHSRGWLEYISQYLQSAAIPAHICHSFPSAIVSWLSYHVVSMHIRYHTTVEHCHSYVSTINTWLLCVNLNTHSSDFTSVRPVRRGQFGATDWWWSAASCICGLCVHLWAMCLKPCLVSESHSECDYNLSWVEWVSVSHHLVLYACRVVASTICHICFCVV